MILLEDNIEEKYDNNNIIPERLMKIHPFNNEFIAFIDGSLCSSGTYCNSNYNTSKESNVIFEEKISNGVEEDYKEFVKIICATNISKHQEFLIDYGDLFFFTEKENQRQMKIISIRETEVRIENEAKMKRSTDIDISLFNLIINRLL